MWHNKTADVLWIPSKVKVNLIRHFWSRAEALWDTSGHTELRSAEKPVALRPVTRHLWKIILKEGFGGILSTKTLQSSHVQLMGNAWTMHSLICQTNLWIAERKPLRGRAEHKMHQAAPWAAPVQVQRCEDFGRPGAEGRAVMVTDVLKVDSASLEQWLGIRGT